MRSRLNFNHLECFLLAARKQSFSEAARELKIAQPAISKQIKTLEELLGMQLFIRSKKSVLLTAAGKELYGRTAHLFNQICEEVNELSESHAEISGTLRFGCLSEVGERVFMQPLSQFKQQYPKIKIEVNFLKAYEIKDQVKMGKLDIGIIPEMIVQENIKCYEIYKEEIILITNPQNPIAPLKKFSDLPFIAYRDNDPLLDIYVKAVSPRSSQSRLNVQMTVNSHRAMARLLMEHPYYAVLPKLSVLKHLQEGELVQVKNKSLHTRLYLIMQDLNIADKRVELLRSHLSYFLREHA